MSMEEDKSTWTRVQPAQVDAFVRRCILAAGGAVDQAHALAEVLTLADMRGHYSHGLNRLDFYVRDVKNNLTNNTGTPIILKETGATAWVDGNNLLGPSVGKFCMDLAIKKAKEMGLGMVVAKGSNHFGIAGWYTIMAKEQGMIGFSCTNTSPVVVPTRAKEAHVGTNPISMAAPAGKDSFVLDMAASTVALGKVEVASRKNISIPETWGCDGQGKSTNDPDLVLNGGGLFPLGGSEELGGYKGYGLSFMVEVLCGILGGARYGPHIRQWLPSEGQSGDLGHCFIVVDPVNFAPNFEERLTDFITSTRSLSPIKDDRPVLIPGDPERIHASKCVEEGGIPYHPNLIKVLRELAQQLQVEPLTK